MSYEQSNVGLGMVQHRKRCRCDGCELERSKTRIAELEAQLAEAREALGVMVAAYGGGGVRVPLSEKVNAMTMACKALIEE